MRVVTDRLPAGASTTDGSLLLRERDTVPRVPSRSGLVVAWALLVAAAFTTTLLLSRGTALWLDEAQTVGIARLPVPDLLRALRTDGSPPFYYLLLHGWMRIFGSGDLAARSLSAVLAVGAVALIPYAGRLFGGKRTAAASALLLASAPFVHRYATEARMYTLVILLTVGWIVLVRGALDQPDTGVLAGVAVVTGLLLLTHYWAFFLLAVAGASLVLRWWRAASGGASRQASRRVLSALALGALAFLPWVPAFLSQLRHTGAPWGGTPGPWMFEASLRALAGDHGGVGLLGFVYVFLAALGLWGQAAAGGHLELDLAGRPVARPLALVVGGTLTLALVVSQLAGSAFAPRYAAVVLVPFLLLAGRGLALIEHRRALPLVVAVLVVLGLHQSFDAVAAARTEAPRIASVLRSRAQPGDLVAFCPDQLAPAVVRLMGPSAVDIATYPPGSPGERVNWVDYLERARRTRPATFAASLHQRAAGATVWLAWSPNYRAVGGACRGVTSKLRRLRPSFTRAALEDYSAYEHASLWRFPPTDD